MLFNNPRALLEAAASAEMLDPTVSDEVKEVITDLDDVLTNNIEEVDDDDKTTNGGIPVVSEAVQLLEASTRYGEARYLVTLEQVMAIMETEGEAEAQATMEDGETPTPEDAAEAAPEPTDVIEQIAQNNGVDKEDVAVVISTESMKMLAQTVIYEAKAGKKGKAAPAKKKLQKMKEVIDKLRKGKIKLVKTSKGKKKKK